MTSDALASSQPVNHPGYQGDDEDHEAGDGDARVQVGSHERSGQNRCSSRKRSQNHKLVHFVPRHSRLISWARMTISS
jgi:hypothetical protein